MSIETYNTEVRVDNKHEESAVDAVIDALEEQYDFWAPDGGEGYRELTHSSEHFYVQVTEDDVTAHMKPVDERSEKAMEYALEQIVTYGDSDIDLDRLYDEEEELDEVDDVVLDTNTPDISHLYR